MRGSRRQRSADAGAMGHEVLDRSLSSRSVAYCEETTLSQGYSNNRAV